MYYYEKLLAKSDRQMLQLLFQVVGIWAIWYQQKGEQAENTACFVEPQVNVTLPRHRNTESVLVCAFMVFVY